MKKIIILASLLLIYFFSIQVANAQTETSCTWKKGRLAVSVSKRCDAYQQKLASNDSACSKSAKPAISTLEEATYMATCCCSTEAAVAETKSTPAKFTMPELQISIPGLKLTPAKSIQCVADSDGACSYQIPWLAEYITSIYNYGLSIAGILAAIILMAGGVLWLISGGDASKVTQAKELIAGSVTGVIILFTSYIILFQINPDLTKFGALNVGTIKEVQLEGDNSSPTVSLDAGKIAAILGINCGQDSISQIVNKSKGKTTYSQGNRTKSAPGGFVYLDCSSFAGFVLKCATGKSSGQRSGDIFTEQKAWDQKLESLQPGDMVGWAPKNNGDNNGHVIIYMGNGVFGDCHGGEAGRRPGNCISNSLSFEKVKAYAGSHSDGKLYLKRY